MKGAGWTPSAPVEYTGSAVVELRAQSVRMLVPGALLALVGWFIVISDAWQTITWLVPLAALGFCVLALVALRRSPRLAAALLVLTLLAANGAALWLYPSGIPAVFFGPIVTTAGILLGPILGAAVAATSSALVVRATSGPEGDLPLDLALAAHFLIWAGALIAWTAARPVHTALDWAWSSYLDALHRAEELRDRQGELNRALKSLTEAYYRLERANQELDRARKAAEEARRQKAEFAANISHELRTPLNLIIGFSEMMTIAPESYGAETLPDTYRGDVEAVYRNACHLSGLIDDVLDLSQIEAGRMGLFREQVTLAQVVDEAVGAITSLFRDKGLRMTVELPLQPVVLYADRTRIRQVLINLLNNAARFTERGEVRIGARANRSEVVVSVADTGPGIPPEELPRIFDEFHRVDGSYQRRPGHGLGLAICKRFVELHGGSIWVESRPGEGSTFLFSLPLLANVVTTPARAQWETWVRVPEGEPPQKTALLLGLDGTTAKSLLRHLDLDGCRVTAAESLEHARQLMAQRPPHAVVAVVASEEQAWEQLTPLREAFRNTLLLVCVARGSQAAARELGVREYLTKPVTHDQVRAALSGLGRRVRDVVVIEDDLEMLRLLARLVRASNPRCRVRQASGGIAGLALLRQRRPDVVLLDLLMPDLDGQAVLREIRREPALADVPVVVITAHGQANETRIAPTVFVSRTGSLSTRDLSRFLSGALDTLAAPPPDLLATSWPEVGHMDGDTAKISHYNTRQDNTGQE
ncbi:MAG: response regulator [Chloroflexi bacterium]|nr:response regulator [Chloroflexota bacterium]